MLSRLLEVHETILIHAHEDAARAARPGDDGTNDVIISACHPYRRAPGAE